MIYSVIRLFSKKEDNKETDSQKNKGKRLAGSTVALGTYLGAAVGNSSKGKTDYLKKAKKIADNAYKNYDKVSNYELPRIDRINERGIDKAFKVANAMNNRAQIKRSLKGAAIGAAISVPIAYGVNKAIKHKNKKKTNRLRQNEEK